MAIDEWVVEEIDEPEPRAMVTADMLTHDDMTVAIEPSGYAGHEQGAVIRFADGTTVVVAKHTHNGRVHIQTYGPDATEARLETLTSGRKDLGERRHYIRLKLSA